MEPFVVIFIFGMICSFLGLLCLFIASFLKGKNRDNLFTLAMVLICVFAAAMVSLFPVMLTGGK